MQHKVIWALAAVNMLLLVALVVQLTSEPATAQPRRPADYVMVPGEVIGGQSSIIYIVDTTNGLLGGMAYEPARDELQVMAPLDLNRIFAAGAGVVAPERVPPGQQRPRPGQ